MNVIHLAFWICWVWGTQVYITAPWRTWPWKASEIPVDLSLMPKMSSVMLCAASRWQWKIRCALGEGSLSLIECARSFSFCSFYEFLHTHLFFISSSPLLQFSKHYIWNSFLAFISCFVFCHQWMLMNEWNEEGRGKRHGTSTLSRERSGSKEVIRSPLCCRKTEKKNKQKPQSRHKTQWKQQSWHNWCRDHKNIWLFGASLIMLMIWSHSICKICS